MQTIRTRRTCARLALLAAAVWPISDALAIRVLAPEISIDLQTNVLSNLRVRYVASAIAAGDGEGASETMDKMPAHWSNPLSKAGQVVADGTRGPGIHGEAEYRALAQVGTLKGLTRAKAENGAAIASADLYMQFMDLIQITREGKLTVVLATGSGGIKNQVHPASAVVHAGSTARADFYVWSAGTTPQPGQFFDFTTYRGATWSETGAVLTEPDRSTPLFLPGSRYWVLGQLWLNSAARGGPVMQAVEPRSLETSADLYRTARFFLAPDPSTPDVSFTSASGFDYLAPVPEPTTWLMLLMGIAMVGVRRASRC